ncbi:MAG: nucleotidyltransferase family protein [Candidatus Omnitrophica bacterium]|nr:nucleotidyltransferase family protein [Candidatus Omnitrophota bacterium]
MKTREDILSVLAREKVSLQRRYPVYRLALFGSYARGEAQSDSDVDLLVEVDPSIGLRFVTLAEDLERLLGLPVDLVSQRAVRPSQMAFLTPELIDV